MKKRAKILNHFKAQDPKLHELMKTLDFDSWLNTYTEDGRKDYFAALCRDIVGQQLSIRAAQTIYNRFSKLLKGNISPRAILKTPDQKLRDVGLSWAKVKYVKDLAQKVINGEVVLENLHTREDLEVINEVIKVKGIGQWTGEMFLIFTLRRENVFSHGDLGLRKAIANVYKLKNPSAKQIDRIIKKWEPYKTYGAIALWHSLSSSKPKPS